MFHRFSQLVVAGLASSLMVSATPAFARDANDWLPLEQGNEWVFGGDEATHTIAVQWRVGPFAYVTGLADHGVWLYDYVPADGKGHQIWVLNIDSLEWHPFLMFDQGLHEEWQYDMTDNACDTKGVLLHEDRLTTTTPAGRFHDARQYDFLLYPEPNVRCAKPDMTSLVVTAGVGPVAFVDSDGMTHALEEATVDGHKYGRAPSHTARDQGLAVTLGLDANLYENQYNTIRCVRAPCPSNQANAWATVTLKVTNETEEAKTFRFTSGQRFDLEIVDRDGRTVARWGEGKMFTQAMGEVVLEPGASVEFTDEMELVDSSGRQLEGAFVMTGWLLDTATVPRVPFDVDLVPSTQPPQL